MTLDHIPNHDNYLLAGSGVDDVEIEPGPEHYAEAEQAHTSGPLLWEALENWGLREQVALYLFSSDAAFAEYAKDYHETSIRLRAVEIMEREVQRSKDEARS